MCSLTAAQAGLATHISAREDSPSLDDSPSEVTFNSSSNTPIDQYAGESYLKSGDLTEHLSRLAISHIGGQQDGPEPQNGLVDEARKLCEAGAGYYFGLTDEIGTPTVPYQSESKPFSYTRPATHTLQELLNVRRMAEPARTFAESAAGASGQVGAFVLQVVFGLVPPSVP